MIVQIDSFQHLFLKWHEQISYGLYVCCLLDITVQDEGQEHFVSF